MRPMTLTRTWPRLHLTRLEPSAATDSGAEPSARASGAAKFTVASAGGAAPSPAIQVPATMTDRARFIATTSPA